MTEQASAQDHVPETASELASRLAQLVQRLKLGAELGLPAFTLKIYVARIRDVSDALFLALDSGDQDDTLEIDDALPPGAGETMRLGLEAHGLVDPVPDKMPDHWKEEE